MNETNQGAGSGANHLQPVDDEPGCDPCCSALDASGAEPRRTGQPWMIGTVTTPIGDVPRVASELTQSDNWGTWKARWGVGRMSYRIDPGLYALGNPTPDSAVLVSANYKLSFDHLRSQLGVHDVWILVLDTRGVNVWCAAGKGTFGTDQIVKQAEDARLSEVVSHRRLVVPQLGAPGVSAHDVKRRCGFRVVYGPVRAEDIPAYLAADMKATPEMRRVRFPLRDRLVLIPVELVMGAKYALIIAAGFLLFAGLGPGIYSAERALAVGGRSALLFLASAVASVALVPALLPWLPGRAFAAKGAWVGLALVATVLGHLWYHGTFDGRLGTAAWILIIPALASFVGMNFTGASTYTSLSGVHREMRIAVPIQAGCAVLGIGLWLTGRFV